MSTEAQVQIGITITHNHMYFRAQLSHCIPSSHTYPQHLPWTRTHTHTPPPLPNGASGSKRGLGSAEIRFLALSPGQRFHSAQELLVCAKGPANLERLSVSARQLSFVFVPHFSRHCIQDCSRRFCGHSLTDSVPILSMHILLIASDAAFSPGTISSTRTSTDSSRTRRSWKKSKRFCRRYTTHVYLRAVKYIQCGIASGVL